MGLEFLSYLLRPEGKAGPPLFFFLSACWKVAINLAGNANWNISMIKTYISF